MAGLHQDLLDLSVSSDAAEALRDRLLRCWDKLFTFLHHDGISWNNTCAEHAIKKFARFREEAAQSMKEEGLKEYLVLLGMYETCRYKGLSFFKFLRSKELELGTYRERKHTSGRPFAIETYPDGYIPRHIASFRRHKAASSGEEPPDRIEDHGDDSALGQGQHDSVGRG